MLRGLALETSGRNGALAIVESGRVLHEERFAHGLKHAAEIIPRISRLCAAQGWGPRDLAELYVSIGPGSFTGLRIAVTLAKTLAYATGVQVVPVPTVHVLAENAPPEARHLIIVLDAKRQQVFTARFDREGEHWRESEPAHLDSLAAMLDRAPRPVHLLGEGILYHRQFIPNGDASILLTAPECWPARAAAVAKTGFALARAGQFTDPLRLVPLYIRPPEAEEKWNAAHG